MENQNDRVLPVDIDAERQVLGAMLQDEGGLEAIAIARTILKTEDFYKLYHKEIFLTFLELADKNIPLDDIASTPYQKLYRIHTAIGDISTPVYIAELKDSTVVATAANIEYYCNKLKELSRLRQIIILTKQINLKAFQYDIDGTTSLDLMSELQGAILNNETLGTVAGKVPTAKQDLPGTLSFLCQARNSEFIGLQTGIKELDRVTLGIRGLSVIGGIPGQGKSSIAVQFATEIARLSGVPVLYYALEMSRNDLYVKTLSRLSQLDYRTLMIGSEINGKRGQGLSEADLKKLTDAIAEYSNYADKIQIIDRAVCQDISIPLVKLHIHQAKRKFNTDKCFVVIDHLQIFPVDKPGLDDMKSRLDYLVSEFKAISEQTEASILLVSEKNRGSYEKEYLGAYMGTAGIEYGVDFAMLLHEANEKDENFNDDKPRKITLKLAKNRFGPRIDIPMMFHKQYSCFEP